jgi:dephospho-CoA kinase
MYIIGLTGGIGSGKSAVADQFRALGIRVVDADQAARAVVEPGTPALAAIAAHFGPGVIQADGGLDRAALRQLVFDNADARRWLEQLLHPQIGTWLTAQLKAAPGPYAILESPLLFESSQHRMVRRALLVDVPEDVQVTRAAARDGNSAEQIRAIMAAQMSRADRLDRADDCIDNSGPPEALAAQVAALHQAYLALATEFAQRAKPAREPQERAQ